MRIIGWLCVMAFMAACSELPRGAAVDKEILKTSGEAEADFAIYPVTRAFLPSIESWPRVGDEQYNWIGATAGYNSQVISPGDTLNIRIWDSGENSLLTGPGSPVADLTEVRVTGAGTVFIPYVGKINVEGRMNSVDLVGGVRAPGSFPMPDQNFSVLSLIAAGGGVDGSLKNPQIRLMRGGKMYGTSINRLYENPGHDTRLRGGDKVIVEADERYFVSMGAAGTQSLYPFTKDQISATDAVAILGGVNAARANPKGILILREYPASAVRPGVRGPRQPRVVFTLDLTNADGLFSARNFSINSGDVVLVTESPINGARTVLGLVGSVFGVFNTANNAAN